MVCHQQWFSATNQWFSSPTSYKYLVQKIRSTWGDSQIRGFNPDGSFGVPDCQSAWIHHCSIPCCIIIFSHSNGYGIQEMNIIRVYQYIEWTMNILILLIQYRLINTNCFLMSLVSADFPVKTSWFVHPLGRCSAAKSTSWDMNNPQNCQDMIGL